MLSIYIGFRFDLKKQFCRPNLVRLTALTEPASAVGSSSAGGGYAAGDGGW